MVKNFFFLLPLSVHSFVFVKKKGDRRTQLETEKKKKRP
jgi:hypothetical protein